MRLKYLDLALVLVQKMQTNKSDWNVLPVVSLMNLNTAAAIGHVMASGAHFAEDGRRFHAIMGTRFTPSWAAISRSWAGWPTRTWSQS